jgi:predicted dehydrogenase
VVIGAGRIGSSFATAARVPGVHAHAQAYRLSPRTELAGIADPDPERLAQAKAAWGCEADQDSRALCERLRPDIVSVCTPDETHARVVADILSVAAPRLLFVEKPLAASVEEAEDLLERARARGCAVALNYSRRFSPAFRAIAQELQEGRHGRPRLARALYSKGLLHNGSHAIDLLRWWFGEPVGVSAHAVDEADDSYAVDLWFPGHVRAHLDPCEEAVATVFEMDVLTERSRWRWWVGGDRWEFSEVRESLAYDGYRAYVPTDRGETDSRFAHPLGECLRHAVDHLAGVLDGQGTLWCTGADGLEALRWVERIRQADERIGARR